MTNKTKRESNRLAAASTRANETACEGVVIAQELRDIAEHVRLLNVNYLTAVKLQEAALNIRGIAANLELTLINVFADAVEAETKSNGRENAAA